jgi:hypothetical protein
MFSPRNAAVIATVAFSDKSEDNSGEKESKCPKSLISQS